MQSRTAEPASTTPYSRTNSSQHYAQERQRRAKKHTLRTVLIVIAVVLVAAGGAAFAYYMNIQSRLNAGIDSSLRDQLTTTEAGEPFYMLLLGVDKNVDREASSEYGSSDSAYRSDSIILARIDPKNVQVTLVSIHRDTMVTLGTHGTQKINAAYAFGGPTYAVQTISSFAGVPISHYAELDFDSFCYIVDTLGGIEVDVPITVDDSTGTGGYVAAGLQTLNGDQALTLCRARHAYDNYGDGDLYRAANQRLVIQAILKKILASDPATLTATVSKLADSVTTDMALSDILSLALQMRSLDVQNSVYSGMEPTNSKYVNSTWYEIVDDAAWKTMMSRVDQGLSPYSSTKQDSTQGYAGSADNIKNAETAASSTAATTSG